MSRRTYDDLLRALGRGELAPVYYLHGTEDILKEEASRAIVDRALEPHERDFNLDLRSAAGLDPEALHTLINTLPMMAARRCVVIKEVEVWKRKAGPREVLLKYLENPSSDTVLVLQETAPADDKLREYEPDAELADRTFSVDVKELEPDRVPRWILHQAKRLGVTLGEGAAEHLAAATGYDLGALRSELEKLTGLPEGGPITREQIGELVGIRHGETLDDWVDAVLGDQTVEALQLTARVLGQSGMSGVKMVTNLGSGLIGLKMTRALYEKGNRGSSLERALFDRFRQIRPFGLGDWKTVTRNWSRWVEAWPAARLNAAIKSTLETDQALKDTRISDEDGTMVGLVLRLSGQAVGRAGGQKGRGQGLAEDWRTTLQNSQ